MKKKTWVLKVVGIVSANLVLCALLGELAVRFISWRKLMYPIEMVKYANRLKVAHEDPAISHRHRKNASARLMGVDIALNSLGHRGKEISQAKRAEDKWVFVLGSSVTMGWGVKAEKVFTHVAERALNERLPFGEYQFTIRNAGIGNYNAYQQWRLFEEQYPLVKPDMVVLHYFINDAEPSATKRNNPIYRFSYLATYLYDWWGSVRYSYSQKLSLVDHYHRAYLDSSQSWKTARESVQKIARKLDEEKLPFLVMVVPDFHNLEKGSPYAPLYTRITETFQESGISVVNLFPAFQKHYGDRESELWIQPDDPHPNEKGHALMASELYRYLVEEDPMHLGLQTKYAFLQVESIH